jgi:hypothetical protein
VSYQGGCAGDLITASLNKIVLNFDQTVMVKSKDFTIKHIPSATWQQAVDLCAGMPYKFISTHQFDIFCRSDCDCINLIVTDSATQQLCVLRQMFLQRLRISVDPASTWYTVVKSLCNRKKYQAAAGYWFEQARQLWIDNMQRRIACRDQVSCTVDISDLFEENFAMMFQQQAPEFDSEVLRWNHKSWLNRNMAQQWTLDYTLQAMSSKLERMNWQQDTGEVVYDQ